MYNFKNCGNTYLFTFGDLIFTLSRIYAHKDGVTKCQLQVTTTHKNYNPHILLDTFTLNSSRSRVELKNRLSTRYKEPFDWDSTLENICVRTLAELDKGEPVDDVLPEDEVPAIEYLIEPLIYKGLPNMIYGDGGSCKSSLAIALCLFVSGVTNPFHWQVTKAKPLYLDWEADRHTFKRELSRLCNGLSAPGIPIKHRNMNKPLPNDIEQIERIIKENGIDFLVIDSLGLAAGSDNLKDPEAATKYYSALNYLGVTSLTLAHPPKKQADISYESSVYGSAFFKYLTRNQWEMRKTAEPDSEEAMLGLFHRKVNYGSLRKPIAIKFEYTDQLINMSLGNVNDVEDFISSLSMEMQIRHHLLKTGKQTIQQIAEGINSKKGIVAVILNRMEKKGKVVHMGKEWGYTENA